MIVCVVDSGCGCVGGGVFGVVVGGVVGDVGVVASAGVINAGGFDIRVLTIHQTMLGWKTYVPGK